MFITVLTDVDKNGDLLFNNFLSTGTTGFSTLFQFLIK